MNRWVIVVLGFLLVTCLNSSQAQVSPAQDLVKRLGCQGCHALAGQGGKRGPGWDRIGQRLNPEALKKQVVSPQGCMPNFAHLKPEELDAEVDYLSGLK